MRSHWRLHATAALITALLFVGLYSWRKALTRIESSRILTPSQHQDSSTTDLPRDTITPLNTTAQLPENGPKKRVTASLRSILASPRFKRVGLSSIDSLHFFVVEDPWFSKQVKDLAESMGSEFVPVLSEILRETSSAETHGVIFLMFGLARKTETIPLLKEYLRQGNAVDESAAAIFALGLMKDQSATGFLKEYYQGISALPRTKGNFQFLQVVIGAIGLHGESELPFMTETSRSFLTAFPINPKAEMGALLAVNTGLWYSHLAVTEVTPAIDSIVLSQEDPRLRFTLICALMESNSPRCLEYLSKVYKQNSDPFLRNAIVQSIGLNASKWGPQWTDHLGDNAQVLNEMILTASADSNKLQDHEKEKWLALLPKLNSPAAIDWLGILVKSDTNSTTTAEEVRARNVLLNSLGTSYFRDEGIGLLLNKCTSDQEKASLLTKIYRPADASLENKSHIDLLLAEASKVENESAQRRSLLEALSHAKASQDKILELIASDYSKGTPEDRLDSVRRAAALGTPALPMIENVLGSQDGIEVRLAAANAFLSLTQSDETLTPGKFLLDKLPELLAPTKKLSASLFLADEETVHVYGNLIRSYYSRFGTMDSLPLLDSLPTMFVYGSDIPPSWFERVKDSLSQDCKTAKDAIILRKQVGK